MSTQPLVVSPDRAGELLFVSRQSIYNMMADGRLPSLKIGRSRRIRVADIEALIERSAVDA